MARNFAQRFNHRYGELFPEPYPFNFGAELVKIPSLDGKGKMSKSENENASLYLADSDELIRKKVMKAVSGDAPTEPNSVKPDVIENLFLLMKLVSDNDVIASFEADYNACTIRYGDLKKQLAEDMVRFIAPIREKTMAIQEDKAYLHSIIKMGKEKARESSVKTLEEARKMMGINFYC
jgi:tryptophanyl-tRNA synthetase